MKRLHVQVCIGFALLGVVAGCSSSGGSDTASASSSTGGPGPQGGRKPKGPPAAVTVDGPTIFAQNCAGCHGLKGVGGKKPPALAGKKIAIADVAQIVENGKGRMPAFGRRFSKEQVDNVSKYVNTL